jgi:hypothetical protein
MYRIAIADSFHLHSRNFPSLFDALENMKAEVVTLLEPGSEGYGLIQCTGKYDNVEEHTTPLVARAINSQSSVMSYASADQLYQSEVANIRLWPLCRSEMLAYLLTLDNWQQDVILKDDREIFNKAFTENHSALTANMAVASYWLNHWYDNRKDLFLNSFCCIFSGSMTYARSLMELLRRSATTVFVLETTFTGNDFIFEEMYRPVANNLGVRNQTLRVGRRDPTLEQPNQYDREVIKARNKLLTAKNKNVQQGEWVGLPDFPTKSEQVLIVGQVANDFSLIEDGFPYVSSIPVYRELIREILDTTDRNVVFKAHPWENRKVHLGAPKTLECLEEFVGTLSEEDRVRVLLVEDVNLYALIEASDYFVTLCSQAAIEAAFLGLRPIVLGATFYSGAGFTTNCANISEVVNAVSRASGLLDIDGYKAVDRFLVDLLQYGTVSVFGSGVSAIRRQFAKPTPLEQKTFARKETSLSQSNPLASAWVPTGVIRAKLPLDNSGLDKRLQEKLDISLVDFPKRLSVDQRSLRVSVHVRNNSDYIIPSVFRGKPFKLSYHIYGVNGERVVWNGATSDLLGDIHQGLGGYMNFEVPELPGTYSVVPALLLPGELWLDGDQKWELTVE